MPRTNANRFGQKFNGTLFGKKANREALMEMLNCFYSGKITVRTLGADGKSSIDTNAEMAYGPLGWLATINLTDKNIGGGSGGSGTVPFSGAGAPGPATLAAGSYVAGPVPSLYVDMTNHVLYACTTAGTAATSVWSQIGGSGSGSSSLKQFKIISDGGDHWNCKAWDGTTLSSNFSIVLKPYKLRAGPNRISGEVIRGVNYSYTYSAVTVSGVVAYYSRSVSGSDGSSETDYMIPDPIANDIIYAQACSTNVLAAAPVGIGDAAVNSGGSSGTYAVNDILTVAGGTGTAATLKVTTVSAGRVTGVVVNTPGLYTVAPALGGAGVTGGGGTGATFNLTLASLLIDMNVDGRAWAAA